VIRLLAPLARIYRENFWLLVAVTAVVQIPYQILNDWLTGATRRQPPFGSAVRGVQIGHLHLTVLSSWALRGTGWQLLALLLFTAAALPLQLGALTKIVAELYQGRPGSIGAAFGAARSRWLVMLGLALLLVVFLFGCVVALGLLDALLVVVLGVVGVAAAVMLWLAAVVAALLLGMRISVAIPIVVLEPVDPWLALSRSWRLTRGSAWRVIGVLLLLTIGSAVFAGLLGAVGAGLAQSVGGSAGSAGQVILLAETIISSLLLTPIWAAAVVLLYFGLRARSEVLDEHRRGERAGAET